MGLHQLLWVPTLLVVLVSRGEAVVRQTALPRGIQQCYNLYSDTTLRDVVGENFCYFCEDRIIQSMTPLRSARNDPQSDQYISGLIDEIYQLKPDYRGKRQAGRGPCRRKEYRMLTDEERNNLHNALNTLKRNGVYDSLASLHSGLVANSAHGGPNFLGWHRVYILLLEFALRRVNPTVCLAYWDSSLDNELGDPRTSHVFSTDFLGSTRNGPINDGPFAGWTMPWGVPLMRNIGATGQLFRAASIRNIMRQSRTSQISPPNADLNNDLEFQHGGIHIYIGGQMRPLQTAAFDPVFFLHHTFVDYLWEMFRNRQRALGIDPQSDFPQDPGSVLHAADANLGFGFNLTVQDGYLNAIANAARYDPSPTCNRIRRDCGSRYLECNVGSGRCVPIVPRSTPPCRGLLCRKRRAVVQPPPSLPVASQPCMNNVVAIQNDYCVDHLCDIRNWVYVAINVVSLRPPGFTSYDSYPVRNGQLVKRYDIYQPSAYEDTSMLSHPAGAAPKRYDRCETSSGIGQIYIEASGMNYNGHYKESSLVDQRLATSHSIAYVAVKNPRKGPVRALFRAFDSCGRICKPTCRIPGTKQYKACSGAMEILHEPGKPNQYSYTYGQASASTWNMNAGSDCPSLDDNGIPLTFYCDYTDRIPWTSASAPRRRPTSESQVPKSGTRECRVDHECTLNVPCGSPCAEGDVQRCRGSCTAYSECVYGQYWKRKCSGESSFDESTLSCVTGRRCSTSENSRIRPIGSNNLRRTTGGRRSHVSDVLGLRRRGEPPQTPAKVGRNQPQNQFRRGRGQQNPAVGPDTFDPGFGGNPFITDNLYFPFGQEPFEGAQVHIYDSFGPGEPPSNGMVYHDINIPFDSSASRTRP